MKYDTMFGIPVETIAAIAYSILLSTILFFVVCAILELRNRRRRPKCPCCGRPGTHRIHSESPLYCHSCAKILTCDF